VDVPLSPVVGTGLGSSVAVFVIAMATKEHMDDFRGNLRKAQSGDQEAFARLWRQYQPGLLRYLKVKAGQATEDLAADTWLRVVRALPAFEGGEDGFRAWIFTTARNRLTDWYRGGSNRLDLFEYSRLALIPARNSVEAEADQRAATEVALALIAELPPDQAEAVVLRIVAGLSVAAVASIMDRTSGSVRVLCHRGLRGLERKLEAAHSSAATIWEPSCRQASSSNAGGTRPWLR
jgi:RNA polymerase sigma-70 factor, ECF subfamily